MPTDRTPHLLIPTCAQCDDIGLREMPELLCDIEERFGFDMLKAFLLEFGGRPCCIAVRPKAGRTQSDLAGLHDWLHDRCVPGSIDVPPGNAGLQTRVAWTIAVHLRCGWSLAATARAAACDLRPATCGLRPENRFPAQAAPGQARLVARHPAKPRKRSRMLINPANLDLAFKGFKTVYTDAYNMTPVLYDRIAMTVPGPGRDETCGWIGQFPRMREWLTGERQIRDLEAFKYTITNRKFESTVSLQREDFADDTFGVFKPMSCGNGSDRPATPG